MISLLLFGVGHAVVTFLVVLGLIAFRLMWGHPAFRVIVSHLPKSWQYWLLGES